MADQFVTGSKFPSLDDADTIRVIEPSFKEVRERLLAKKSQACSEVSK